MSSPNGGGSGGSGGSAPASGGVSPTSGGPLGGHLPRLIGSYQPARPSGKKPMPAGHKPARKVHGKLGSKKGGGAK